MYSLFDSQVQDIPSVFLKTQIKGKWVLETLKSSVSLGNYGPGTIYQFSVPKDLINKIDLNCLISTVGKLVDINYSKENVHIKIARIYEYD